MWGEPLQADTQMLWINTCQWGEGLIELGTFRKEPLSIRRFASHGKTTTKEYAYIS